MADLAITDVTEFLNETTTQNGTAEDPCDIDPDPQLRLAFLSVGTIIAIAGCASNAILFYTFIFRSKRPNPYQTFLAFLDFMLCFLFICCFGAPAAATTFKIEPLYLLVKDNSVEFLIISRMVQISIPYVLILNTADRLQWMESDENNQQRIRIGILVLVVFIVALLRVPGYFVIQVYDIPGCDLFASKVLTGVAMNEFFATVYRYFDISVQFLHLFVSFIVLFVLNVIVIRKLRSSHKRARRQSSCPQALNTVLVIMHCTVITKKFGNGLGPCLEHRLRTLIEQEEKREHKRLRYAIKTTIVLISSYLVCNSVNFILFSIEMWNTQVLMQEGSSFNVWYVAASDMGTNLFVFSSAIRLFIFYKYNPEIRAQLRTLLDPDSYKCCKKIDDKKVEILIGVPL